MKIQRRLTTTRRRKEGGIVIVLLALLLAVIFGIVAMVVDGSRQTIVAEHVQNAVDAASLAAVKQLNGKPSGMRLAKRAAVAVLKQAQINGTTVPLGINFQLNEPAAAPIDLYEDPSDPQNRFPKTEGTSGNIHVKIERGFYRDLGGASGEVNFQFQSLEGAATFFDIDAHVLANAVRTTIQISNVPTSFGRVLGKSTLETVTRTSVSVFDSEVEPCVAPIAVPLCLLMQNTGASANFTTTKFDAGMQCEREWTAMEAVPEVDSRLEGLTRAKWYPLQPYIYLDGTPTFCMNNAGGYAPGNYLNCKATEGRMTLGVPASDPSVQDLPASPGEVASTLLGNGGCVKARAGMRFRAMLNSVDNGGNPLGTPNSFLQTQPNSPLEIGLKQLINQSPDSQNFDNVFKQGGQPKPNYPHLRRLHGEQGVDPFTELRVQWPTTDQSGFGEMYMAPKGNIGVQGVPDDPNQWINPAAHTAGIGAKVKPLNIMVVANGNQAEPYCDFPALFAGNSPNAFPLASSSEPTIVGFVKAYLIDFHIQQHAPNEIIPNDNNPWSVRDWGLDAYAQQVHDYFDHHHDWAEIEKCVECQQYPCDMNPNTPEPLCSPGPWCEAPGSCQNPGPPPQPPGNPPALPPYVAGCFETPPNLPNFSQFDVEVPPQYNAYQNALANAQAQWDDYLDGMLDSLANKQCIPSKIDNCYPSTNPGCWEVKNQKPQYLLGGLRLRLDCASDQVLTSAHPKSKAKPLLVD